MATIEERLVPKDGLNNYNVVLARMEMPTHGGAQFSFAVTNSMVPVAELLVNVPAAGQSLDRMTVEAHDALIDILRQLTFRVEKARSNHEKNAGKTGAPPLFRMDESNDLEFVVDRRGRTERRADQTAETEQLA